MCVDVLNEYALFWFTCVFWKLFLLYTLPIMKMDSKQVQQQKVLHLAVI